MNKLRHALCVILVATTCALRAADKDEDENPLGDFMPTNDDLVQYVPKYTMKLGFRALSGAHTYFSGKGGINLGLLPTDTTTPNINRVYHDGYVYSDQTTVADPAGNSSSNTQSGLTNVWSYASSSQVKTTDTGTYIDMHDYRTEIQPVDNLKQNPATSLGIELTAERDMGKVFNTRLHWGVIVGFAVNQISSIREINEPGYLYTVTDEYRYGDNTLPYGTVAVPPTGPYTSSSSSTNQNVISSVPTTAGDRNNPEVTSVLIDTRWRLRGAYATFRAGPTLDFPITAKLSANLSAGAVLMYIGTSYDVEQKFKPDTGDYMEYTVSDGASTVLPGFFIDANLQYTMTENSGMYLGAVLQSTPDYTQTIKNTDGSSEFKAKTEFGNMEGVKAGFLFKF